jgi:hypothetical protein
MEITRAHRRANPKSTPARVQEVMVPGPIKAAAIRNPGPIFFSTELVLI